MKLRLEPNKRYICVNADGVVISGVVSRVENGTVYFGQRGTVWIHIHGWTVEEVTDG